VKPKASKAKQSHSSASQSEPMRASHCMWHVEWFGSESVVRTYTAQHSMARV
jgi:hypothetical protein